MWFLGRGIRLNAGKSLLFSLSLRQAFELLSDPAFTFLRWAFMVDVDLMGFHVWHGRLVENFKGCIMYVVYIRGHSTHFGLRWIWNGHGTDRYLAVGRGYTPRSCV